MIETSNLVRMLAVAIPAYGRQTTRSGRGQRHVTGYGRPME